MCLVGSDAEVVGYVNCDFYGFFGSHAVSGGDVVGETRCCELTLAANDIFDTWSPSLTINHAGQDYRMTTVNNTRSLRLAFAWRFNGFKLKESGDRLDTSRFGAN